MSARIRTHVEVMHEGVWVPRSGHPTYAEAEVEADLAYEETGGRDVRVVQRRGRRVAK
jgi:hypothetical protein